MQHESNVKEGYQILLSPYFCCFTLFSLFVPAFGCCLFVVLGLKFITKLHPRSERAKTSESHTLLP